MRPQLETREGQPLPTLAYLGPKGTFTELAATTLLNMAPYADHIMVECKSITEICEQVAAGRVDRGVVPIENSTAGDVKDTLLAFSRPDLNLRIGGELVLPIKQYLFKRPDAQVLQIVTKDSAYYQSEEHVRRMYPEHTSVFVDSTATGVRMAADDPTIAAIGSANAAESLGIEDRLERIGDMEDNPNNATTFVVIQKNGEAKPSGNDKTTFILSLIDQPGSLYHYLDVLNSWGVNLNKIRSFGRIADDKASFLVSIDGHASDFHVGRALQYNPRREKTPLKMLGSYPRAEYIAPEVNGIPDLNHIVKQVQDEMRNGSTLTQNETVIVFTLNDQPGALMRTLRPFAEREINLVAIDSMPTRRKMGEYAFYLAFDKNSSDQNSAIGELAKHCAQVILLNAA